MEISTVDTRVALKERARRRALCEEAVVAFAKIASGSAPPLPPPWTEAFALESSPTKTLGDARDLMSSIADRIRDQYSDQFEVRVARSSFVGPDTHVVTFTIWLGWARTKGPEPRREREEGEGIANPF